MPQTEIVMLPDCKHSPHRDQAERTLERMAEFVARLQREPMAPEIINNDGNRRSLDSASLRSG